MLYILNERTKYHYNRVKRTAEFLPSFCTISKYADLHSVPEVKHAT